MRRFECAELLASLSQHEVAPALYDPALVVALAKFRRHAPQFPDDLKYLTHGNCPLRARMDRSTRPLHSGARTNE
jgi:hypothetical protein